MPEMQEREKEMIVFKYTLTDDNKLLKQRITTQMFERLIKNRRVWFVLLFDEKDNELPESGFRYDYFVNEVLDKPLIVSRRICYFTKEKDEEVFTFYKEKLKKQMERAMKIFTKTVSAHNHFDWEDEY